MAIWGPIRIVSDEEMAAENAEYERQRALHLAELCPCTLEGAMPYLLEVEENRITGLKCTACGKSVMSERIEDLLFTSTDLPVTVRWVKERDSWEGEPGDFYGEISPRPDGGEAS